MDKRIIKRCGIYLEQLKKFERIYVCTAVTFHTFSCKTPHNFLTGRHIKNQQIYFFLMKMFIILPFSFKYSLAYIFEF